MEQLINSIKLATAPATAAAKLSATAPATAAAKLSATASAVASALASAPVIDKESIIQKQYAAQLKKENTKLVKTIRKKQSNLRVYNQVNFYYSQDEVMFVYIQKVLTILYAVIYFFFMYFLYSNQEKYSRQMIILYLVIFLLLPFTFHLISKFLYNSFLMFLQIFNNGNAAYLYSTVPSGQN